MVHNQLELIKDTTPVINKNDIYPIIAAIKDNDLEFIEASHELLYQKYGNSLLSYSDNELFGGFIAFAIKYSTLEILQFFIDNKYNLHLLDLNYPDCAFKYACLNNKLPQVQMLLNATTMDFNTSHDVILEFICKENKLELLELLFKNRNKNSNPLKNTPFIWESIHGNFGNACFYGNIDIINFFLLKKYEIQDLSPFIYSFHNSGSPKITELLIDKFGDTIKSLLKFNNDAHHQIFEYMENNPYLNDELFMQLSINLTKLDFNFILLNKNQYPKLFSIVEAEYYKKILKKHDEIITKVHKI